MKLFVFWILSTVFTALGSLMLYGGRNNPVLALLGMLSLFGGVGGIVICGMLGFVESTVTRQHNRAAKRAQKAIEEMIEEQMDPLGVRGKLKK